MIVGDWEVVPYMTVEQRGGKHYVYHCSKPIYETTLVKLCWDIHDVKETIACSGEDILALQLTYGDINANRRY